MIVQSAAAGAPHFVIAMDQHTTFAGALARHFGNEEFSGLEPRGPMEFVVANHDRGWAALDAEARQDPETGLPYNLTATPLADIVGTSAGSPDFNESHHPFSGLISSMHSYGLYKGRYGLSDKLFIDLIADDMRPGVDAMLDGELERQARLRSEIEADRATAPFADDDVLFHCYKQLQFFDTLSLYFHMTHEGERGESQFDNVPRSVGDDVTVTVREQPDGIYQVDPYPFDRDGLGLTTEGRYLEPQPTTDLAPVLSATALERQAVRLVAA